MELHEFHVLSGKPARSAICAAVACAGMGGSRGEIGAAIAARREHGHLGAEAVESAVVELQRHDASAAAFLIHDQVDGEIFSMKNWLLPFTAWP